MFEPIEKPLHPPQIDYVARAFESQHRHHEVLRFIAPSWWEFAFLASVLATIALLPIGGSIWLHAHGYRSVASLSATYADDLIKAQQRFRDVNGVYSTNGYQLRSRDGLYDVSPVTDMSVTDSSFAALLFEECRLTYTAPTRGKPTKSLVCTDSD